MVSQPHKNQAGGAPGRWATIAGCAGLAVASLTAALVLVLAPAAGASTADPASTTVLTTPGATTSVATGTSGAAASGSTGSAGSATAAAGGSTTEVTVPGAGSASASFPAVTDAAPGSPTLPAGTGADSLLGPPKIRYGNTKTFAEKYGSSSYSLTEASTSTSSSAEDGALGAVTDALWAMVTLLVGFAISVVQWAFHLDLASVIAPTLHQITGKLAKLIFDPWVATVVVVGAAWLVWWGLVRRRASIAGEGAVWMLVALVAAIAFLAQPTSLLVGADHVTSSIGTSALSALAPITPADSKVAGAVTPASAYKKGPAADVELRRASNTIWDTYVYEPWLVAEFGSISAGTTAGPAWLALQANGGTIQAEQAVLAAQPSAATGTGSPGVKGTSSTGPSASAGAGTSGTATSGSTATAGSGGTSGTTVGKAGTKAAASAATQAWFAGSYPAGRFGVVLVAFVAAAALCALLVALALAVLLAQVALVLLVALAPVFLLLGIHPGQGRRVALRWAELAVAAVLKRVVYSVALAVVLVVIGTLIALMSAAGVGWALTTLLPTLAMVALIVFRKRVIHALVGTGSAISLRAGAESARLPEPLPSAVPRHSAPSQAPLRGARDTAPRHRPAAAGQHEKAAGGTRPPWWAATRHPAPGGERPPAGQGPGAGSIGGSAAEAGPEHRSDRDPAPVG